MKEKVYCKNCGKELKIWNNVNKKYYPYKNKTGLCKNCCAKERYNKRGAFTHNHGKFWTKEELGVLIKEYPSKTCEEIGKIINRKPSSIQHKANRLGIHKDLAFWKEHPIITSKLFKSKNNPMYIKEIKDKANNIRRLRYKQGKYKITGAALKSHLGLTKKENHPNWLGGKSFEPYDSRFDKSFCKLIRERDKMCLICHKLNEQELLESKQRLCIHHIDYNKKNTIKENCASLCNSCHIKTNYNRSSWIKFFQTLLSDKYGYDYENNSN